MSARRDVEMLLQREENDSRSEYGGGLKQHRKLRKLAAEMTGITGLKPKPPKGRKKRGGGGGGGYAGPLGGGDTMDAPSLQPMPRFMGAGPAVDGKLLMRGSRNGGDKQFTSVLGTV